MASSQRNPPKPGRAFRDGASGLRHGDTVLLAQLYCDSRESRFGSTDAVGRYIERSLGIRGKRRRVVKHNSLHCRIRFDEVTVLPTRRRGGPNFFGYPKQTGPGRWRRGLPEQPRSRPGAGVPSCVVSEPSEEPRPALAAVILKFSRTNARLIAAASTATNTSMGTVGLWPFTSFS